MERRRLPSYAVEAYDILRDAAPEADDGRREIPPEAARTALEDTDEEFTTGDIDHVLDLLYNRGEIYHVNDQIRFTDLKEFDKKYHDNEEEDDE
ncbi:hypothetical protein [Halococcus salifodinae]|uniref:Uncharacterized protein n=1 Tax=Halococcus salifodinae DSM 8989 TaxID=1227456 RepID=M0N9Y9_9EURY|nr:hypothetical protein [Halococcus salifodinae]EMA54388.1 hypothetical protein C450_06145 [Halococcus salifodinae DSM 8989]